MKCIVCGCNLDPVFPETHQPSRGLVFWTYGHYGSTYFDPMDNSKMLIFVCDPCIEKNKDKTVFKCITVI